MRKLIFLLSLWLISAQMNGAIVLLGNEKLMAKEIMIPLPGSSVYISLQDLSTMKPGDYKALTGKKLSFGQKVKLLAIKKYSRKLIRPDGSVNTTRLKKREGFFGGWHWHWGGFALGFLILIGPIIALFFKDEHKWDRFWTALTVTSALTSVLYLLMAI